MRQQQEGSRSRANKQSNRGEGTGQTLLPYEEEPLAIVVAAARPLCEQTKPKYVSSCSSPCSCTSSSSSSPVFAMSNQLAARIMPHSNLCRSWVICSTRSFRVLHAGVDTHSSPNQPRHPPPSLTAELYASPSSGYASPRVLLCPCSLVILQVGVNICQARAALSPVHNPQSTCSHSPSTIFFSLPSFVLGLRFLSIYFCFCRFRSTFLMPVKHENAFAIPTFTCISPSLSPLPPVPALYPSLASVAL